MTPVSYKDLSLLSDNNSFRVLFSDNWLSHIVNQNKILANHERNLQNQNLYASAIDNCFQKKGNI